MTLVLFVLSTSEVLGPERGEFIYLAGGTTAHYSPPIMPHRAPFLCLNWDAVCTLMNYGIYLLRRSEGCLEKLLQTLKYPRVRSLIYANSEGVFFFFFFRQVALLQWWISTSVSAKHVVPLYNSFTGPQVWMVTPSLLFSYWCIWKGASPSPALVFGQLESVYTSVTPHPNSSKKDELSWSKHHRSDMEVIYFLFFFSQAEIGLCFGGNTDRFVLQRLPGAVMMTQLTFEVC